MKNVLLVGLGRFGKHIAMQLSQLGHEIMAVDWNEERVGEVLPFVTNAQIGDSTNAEFLRSLGIGNYDICFVAIGGSFQNSLETTSLLKELGAKLDNHPGLNVMFRKNFFYVMVPIKWFIPKNRLQNGPLSVTQMTISLTIWR